MQNAIAEVIIRLEAIERQSSNIILRLEFLETANQYGPSYHPFNMSLPPMWQCHSRISPSMTPNYTQTSLTTPSENYSTPVRALTPSSLSNSNGLITPANNPQSPTAIVTVDDPVTSTSVTSMPPTMIDKENTALPSNDNAKLIQPQEVVAKTQI